MDSNSQINMQYDRRYTGRDYWNRRIMYVFNQYYRGKKTVKCCRISIRFELRDYHEKMFTKSNSLGTVLGIWGGFGRNIYTLYIHLYIYIYMYK